MNAEVYPFPGLGPAGQELPATECVVKCLAEAEASAAEVRSAIVNAREYVSKDFALTFGALTVAYERRVAMHAWVHFARAYHTIAIAWEAMGPSDKNFDVVMRLQKLEEESELMSENAEAVACRLGTSHASEACR